VKAGKIVLVGCAALGLLLSSLACCCGVPAAIREGLEGGWPLTVVRGSGDVVEVQRDVTSFSGVALRGIGHLYVEQGEAVEVTIEAEDNLVPYLETWVDGAKLVISTRERVHLRPTRPIVIRVTLVDLDRLEVSGSGDAEGDGLVVGDISFSVSGSGHVVFTDLEAEDVDARISGSGTIDLSGQARSQELNISGSGDYRAERFETEEADVRISGSGSAILNVSERLEAKISGSGSVRYTGSPSVESSVTGSGSVRRLAD
jgi:hypothetical protein